MVDSSRLAAHKPVPAACSSSLYSYHSLNAHITYRVPRNSHFGVCATLISKQPPVQNWPRGIKTGQVRVTIACSMTKNIRRAFCGPQDLSFIGYRHRTGTEAVRRYQFYLDPALFEQLLSSRCWRSGCPSHRHRGWPWWSSGRAYRRRYRARSVLTR